MFSTAGHRQQYPTLGREEKPGDLYARNFGMTFVKEKPQHFGETAKQHQQDVPWIRRGHIGAGRRGPGPFALTTATEEDNLFLDKMSGMVEGKRVKGNRTKKRAGVKTNDRFRNIIMNLGNWHGNATLEFKKLHGWTERQLVMMPSRRNLKLPGGTADRVDAFSRLVQEACGRIQFDMAAVRLEKIFKYLKRNAPSLPSNLQLSFEEKDGFHRFLQLRFSPGYWHDDDQLKLMRYAIIVKNKCEEMQSRRGLKSGASRPTAKSQAKSQAAQEIFDTVAKLNETVLAKLAEAGNIYLELALGTWERQFGHAQNIMYRSNGRARILKRLAWEEKRRGRDIQPAETYANDSS